jgi:hypothetical protein
LSGRRLLAVIAAGVAVVLALTLYLGTPTTDLLSTNSTRSSGSSPYIRWWPSRSDYELPVRAGGARSRERRYPASLASFVASSCAFRNALFWRGLRVPQRLSLLIQTDSGKRLKDSGQSALFLHSSLQDY